jgi:leader peptidase (prepilin peptidase)/N-methyltransferase
VAAFFDPSFDWLSHVIGGVAGFAVFYGVYAIFYYGLKKDALGGGDIKLAAVMGLMLGWERLILGTLIASVAGSIILVIISRMQKADRETEYPFAPFLCTGFWVALMFGAQIIQAYLSLFGM